MSNNHEWFLENCFSFKGFSLLIYQKNPPKWQKTSKKNNPINKLNKQKEIIFLKLKVAREIKCKALYVDLVSRRVCAHGIDQKQTFASSSLVPAIFFVWRIQNKKCLFICLILLLSQFNLQNTSARKSHAVSSCRHVLQQS